MLKGTVAPKDDLRNDRLTITVDTVIDPEHGGTMTVSVKQRDAGGTTEWSVNVTRLDAFQAIARGEDLILDVAEALRARAEVDQAIEQAGGVL